MKTEYAQEVAERIIEQLKQGTAPWQKPWKPGELVLPFNPTTDKEYRGINSLWLHCQGYADPRWMTFKQALGQDAQVRKGSKGTHIQYWKTADEQVLTDAQGKPVMDENGQPKKQLVQLENPRMFTAVVFNAEQIDGLPAWETKPIQPEPERLARAETILSNSGADIDYLAGNKAFYSPKKDAITLPHRHQFESSEAFYATALHELGHWTGHPSRLDRDLLHPFGSTGYAREELRAEIASLMLGERLGLGFDPGQHVAYVGSWIKALEEDPREIFRASSDAERITSFVMGFEQEQEKMVERQNEPSPIRVHVAEPAVLHTPTEQANHSRTYLVVPYLEKHEAKTLGAKWDRDAKAWYAPEGVELVQSGLIKWHPDKVNAVQVSPQETVEAQFKHALQAVGLKLDGEPVADGKLHRVAVDGDKGHEKSGAYALYLNTGLPGGFIQNFKTGEAVNWKAPMDRPALTADERAQLAQEAAEQRQIRQAQQTTTHEATAQAAQSLWDEAPPATADHPYCKLKGIANPAGLRVVPNEVSPEALKLGIRIAHTGAQAKALREDDPKHRIFMAGDLLIPGKDMDGKLWTLQSVSPKMKFFMKDARKAGTFAVIGADTVNHLARDEQTPLVLTEGYATGDTVSRLMDGKPVIVAFDSGNLHAVAGALRERFVKNPLVIAADNDHQRTPNVGMMKAQEAAQNHGGAVLSPTFKPDEKGTDWNDFAASRGDEAAKKVFAEQMAIAKLDAAIAADRWMSLAREREAEAQNDPTLNSDDKDVAAEREQAHETMDKAQAQLGEVNNLANSRSGDAQTQRASLQASVASKVQCMHEAVKQEREAVVNHAHHENEGSWKKMSMDERQEKIDAVKQGIKVNLPMDAPPKLRKAAGLEVLQARGKSYGAEAEI